MQHFRTVCLWHEGSQNFNLKLFLWPSRLHNSDYENSKWERNCDWPPNHFRNVSISFYCTRLKSKRERKPERAMCINYFLTFRTPSYNSNSQQMLPFIWKEVFIECRIKFYAVIYDFIEHSSRSRKGEA